MPVQAQVIVIPSSQAQVLAPIGPWATWSKDGWSLQTLVDLLQWHPSMVECSQSFSVFMASHSSCLAGVGVAMPVQAQVIVPSPQSQVLAPVESWVAGVGVAMPVQAQVIVIPSPQSQVLAPVESWVAGVGVAMPVQAQVIVIPSP